jgi:hypothetical protein
MLKTRRHEMLIAAAAGILALGCDKDPLAGGPAFGVTSDGDVGSGEIEEPLDGADLDLVGSDMADELDDGEWTETAATDVELVDVPADEDAEISETIDAKADATDLDVVDTPAPDAVPDMPDTTDVADTTDAVDTTDTADVADTTEVPDGTGLPDSADADSTDIDAVAPEDTTGPVCETAAPFSTLFDKNAAAVMTDSAGGVVVAGNVLMPAGAGPGLLWLARFGSDGTPAWERTYAGVLGSLVAAARAPSGQVAMLRYIGGGNGGINIVSAQADGNPLWDKDFAQATPGASVHALLAAADGGFWVLGRRSKLGKQLGWALRVADDSTLVGEQAHAGIDRWLTGAVLPQGDLGVFGRTTGGVAVAAGLDASGHLLWQKPVIVNMEISGAVATADGGFYVVGIVEEPIDYGMQTEPEQRHLAVVRLDASGNTLWSHDHDWTDAAAFVGPSAIAVTSDGGYAVGSSFSDGHLKLMKNKGQPVPAGSVFSYAYLHRGTADGKVLWARSLVPTGWTSVSGGAMVVLCDGSVAFGGLTGAAGKGTKGWLVRTDAAGNLLPGLGVTVAPVGGP